MAEGIMGARDEENIDKVVSNVKTSSNKKMNWFLLIDRIYGLAFII
jgi:hypothetical protein